MRAKNRGRGEADTALAKTAALRDLGFEFGRRPPIREGRSGDHRKVEFFSDPDLASRAAPGTPTHSDRPPPGVSAELRPGRGENLWPPDCAGLGAGPAARSGGRRAGPGNTRVLFKTSRSSGRSKSGNSRNFRLAIFVRPSARLPIQMQQARSGAVRQWLLRNAFGRQIIVEIRDEHRGDYRV